MQRPISIEKIQTDDDELYIVKFSQFQFLLSTDQDSNQSLHVAVMPHKIWGWRMGTFSWLLPKMIELRKTASNVWVEHYKWRYYHPAVMISTEAWLSVSPSLLGVARWSRLTTTGNSQYPYNSLQRYIKRYSVRSLCTPLYMALPCFQFRWNSSDAV